MQCPRREGHRHRDPGGRRRRRRHAADGGGHQPRAGGRRADRGRGQQDRQGGRRPGRSDRSSPSTGWWPRTSAATPCSSTSPRRTAPTSPHSGGRPADRRRGAGPAGQPRHGSPGCGHRGAPGPRPRPGGHRADPARHAAGRRLGGGGDAYGRVRAHGRRARRGRRGGLPVAAGAGHRLHVGAGAGDNFLVVDEDRIARQIADRRSARKRNALAERARKRISLEDLDSALKETSQLNLILKGDNAGTVEALEEALLGIGSTTRWNCASSTAASVVSPRPTSTWLRRRMPSSSASTSAPRARPPSWPTARVWRSATTR